uniref:MADS-box domain-containing protein n=1 Tax=Setaria italica TaxID=4555 RepID=K3ZNZ1_SETIT
MAQSQTSFSEHTNTLFSMAQDLSQEFGAYIIVVTFSPTGEPKAYGAPTADSILCTYLPEIHSLPSPTYSKTAGEVTARAAAWSKILAAQMSAGKQNWWEVDVEALRVDELPVFVRALEVLRTDVQRHLDAMESSRKENMQPYVSALTAR